MPPNDAHSCLRPKVYFVRKRDLDCAGITARLRERLEWSSRLDGAYSRFIGVGSSYGFVTLSTRAT
jgi:hypothetical protein